MDELLLPCAVKACTYFCGEGDKSLDLIQVRTEEGSPSLVMEATNGWTAIQITTNNPEFELDEFTIAIELSEAKKWLKNGSFPETSEVLLPDISAAVSGDRSAAGAPLSPSRMQMRFWTETSSALRALFKQNVTLSLSATEDINSAMAMFVEGESRDGPLVVVEIFIMRTRE